MSSSASVPVVLAAANNKENVQPAVDPQFRSLCMKRAPSYCINPCSLALSGLKDAEKKSRI